MPHLLPQSSMRYCSKSLVHKNSSKLSFVAMFLQVHKYFFCNKANRLSLLWVEFDICNGQESSNVLNKLSLLKSCTFSFWYSFWKGIPFLREVWVEVYPRSLQNLTLFKTKIAHFAILFKTRDLIICVWFVSFYIH